jgi:hypothetical protein
MRKLSELVKKRSELEAKILTLIQSSENVYEITNNSISVSLERALTNLH